ncbi:MAG: sulfite exporter TauE/SafE family protein [Kofleriaceae bacterium]|nr:sulfite exporter TauE/SafE family protein [Kofleriaceae bacterium]
MALSAIIAISLVATLVRSTFGFGESLVAVPLFVLVVPIEVAVPLSVLVSVLVALVVVVQDRRAIHVSSAGWLVAFAALGIPLGLCVLIYADPYSTKIGLGCLIMAFSAYSLASRRVLHLERDSRAWLFACGFLSGVMGGAYGLNGPPLVVYGNLRRWSASHFRATLQAYFLVASLIGTIGYAARGLIDDRVWRYFLYCVPAVVPAIFIGRHLNAKLARPGFFRYVYIVLIAVGAVLIIQTVAGSGA